MKQIKTFLAVAFLLTAIFASAQTDKPLRLGIGIIPGASLNNPAGFVLGADVRLQQGFGNSNVSWILTTGYTHFFETKQNGIVMFPTTSFIPLKAGLKVFPAANVYLAGEIGAGFGIETGVGTSFVYSPSIGIIVAKDWDLSIKYEHFTKYNETQQLALRIAYGFKL
jgi:hypothetical protein